MTAARPEPLFLHAMWRTGSSYLLSRFAAAPGYLTFYEPFNGEIGSRRLRSKAEADYDQRLEALRHPSAGESYFAVYDQRDPKSGQELWRFSAPSLPLYDVYNGLSKQGSSLLEACINLAQAQGHIAALGHCHSGLQIAQMRERFGGRHVYLTRAAREQFFSYAPLANDFFMAATILQLLSSARLQKAARELAPSLAHVPFSLVGPFVRDVPHRVAMRMGRSLWRRLDYEEMYGLFYLSWLASNETGRSECDAVFSLTQLQEDAAHRAQVESQFGISFAGLSHTPDSRSNIEVEFDAIERRVESLLAAQESTPDGRYQLSA